MTPHIPANASAGTPTELRNRNRSLILNALRLKGSLSKAELSRLLGLSPPSIGNIVEDLVKSGLVQQAGRRKTARGQPPIEIELNENGAYSVGIRIDYDSYDLAVCDFGGRVIETDAGATAGHSEEELLDLIVGIYRRIVAHHGAKRCLGLGIVTPGPFDAIWPGSPTPGSITALQTFSILPKLSRQIGNNVFMENDATAAALSEKIHGIAKNLTNFFFAFIGEGVGGGLVIGGMPYIGQSRNAGEFGHLIVDPDGLPCYCGNRGCLGQYLSLQARRRFLAEDPKDPKRAGLWLTKAAEMFSIALANIENLLDPEVVILGGTAPRDLLGALEKQLGALRPSVRAGLSGPRLSISHLGEQSAALGASSLPFIAALSFRPENGQAGAL